MIHINLSIGDRNVVAPYSISYINTFPIVNSTTKIVSGWVNVIALNININVGSNSISMGCVDSTNHIIIDSITLNIQPTTVSASLMALKPNDSINSKKLSKLVNILKTYHSISLSEFKKIEGLK